MSNPEIGDTGEGYTVDGGPGQEDDGTLGFEGYPYASVEAEKRIKLVTSLFSVIALTMLVTGLYFLLGTGDRVGVGGLLALFGFIDLMIVPVIAKRMRRAALAREDGIS
ncbi:hypothetical protein BH23ACT9_BH23ACT9_29880 [soil metagenome]